MVHQTAIVHPGATIGKNVEIGPYCLVGEHVVIGDHTKLLAHVVVTGRTTIGEHVVIHPFATIGTTSQDRKAVKGEVAYTTIGDRTVIREYTSIQRGTGEGSTTSVGSDCLLLAYVHIAHNCEIGNFVTMSNLAQLAGHVRVFDYASIGGATGVHQFTRIGRYAFVGGMTRLGKDVPPYFLAEGNPPKVRDRNREGIKRAGISPEAVTEIKRCFRTLYLSNLNLTQGMNVLRGTMETPEGREILEFIDAVTDPETDRGIAF